MENLIVINDFMNERNSENLSVEFSFWGICQSYCLIVLECFLAISINFKYISTVRDLVKFKKKNEIKV